jgi:predicted small lipoprotein YifL
MTLRMILAFTLAVSLAACGTKDNLLKPDGKPTPKSQKDPSQPATPITR